MEHDRRDPRELIVQVGAREEKWYSLLLQALSIPGPAHKIYLSAFSGSLN